MPSPFIIAIVAVVVVVDVIVFALIIRHKQRQATNGPRLNKHWQWLAEQFDLQVAGGEPAIPGVKFLSFLRKPVRLEGEHGHGVLKLYRYSVRSGNNSTTYTTVRNVAPNPRELTFRLSPEGLLTKLGKAMGAQDVETGDEAFDRRMVVKCSDPDFIRTALLPEVRSKILAFWDDHKPHGTIMLDGEELFYFETGTIRSEKTRNRFAAATELLAKLRGLVMYHNR